MDDYLVRETSVPVGEDDGAAAAVSGSPATPGQVPLESPGSGGLVHVLVHVPRRAAAQRERAPLVVCCHGLGESGLRVAPLAQRLTLAGATTVCPSFRGGGAPTAGPTTAMSVGTQLDDVRAVVRTARTWPFVDTSRVALFGRSLGGLVAALAAARHPHEIMALVLWYPALGSPESLRQRFGALSAVPRTFTHRVEGRDILLSRRYAADAWNLNVDTELARFRGPVLIVHGNQDRDVPLAVSQRAAAILPDARLVTVPGAAHGFADEHLVAATRQSIDFLEWAGVLGAGEVSQ
ncbi:alpha/beta hydrolase family protein [Actinomyces oricola]|uniref:alpha/beta hydrolase family protein n=1 Tax=Actinomyces oricola TaxID=206043 RepID=UPI000FFEB831|nr:alpha/beta fold hydrolase [Actinomyces oricola]